MKLLKINMKSKSNLTKHTRGKKNTFIEEKSLRKLYFKNNEKSHICFHFNC